MANIVITTDTNGINLAYNDLSSVVKFKKAYVKKSNIQNVALSADESWVEVDTLNKTYQFTYPVLNSLIAVVDSVDGITVTNNSHLYDLFKAVIS